MQEDKNNIDNHKDSSTDEADLNLDSLEDNLTPEEIERLNLERLEQEKRDALVNYIYHQTSLSKVTGEKELLLNPPGDLEKEALVDMLSKIKNNEEMHEDLLDIKYIEGKKDIYYYDKSIMTDHYAEIDVMLQDKDILHTIAETTRFDCKTYPSPSQFKKFRAVPFKFTQDEILGAVARMKFEPGYEDIDVVTASNGEMATFSTLHMTKKYAQALIEFLEVEEPNNP